MTNLRGPDVDVYQRAERGTEYETEGQRSRRILNEASDCSVAGLIDCILVNERWNFYIIVATVGYRCSERELLLQWYHVNSGIVRVWIH